MDSKTTKYTLKREPKTPTPKDKAKQESRIKKKVKEFEMALKEEQARKNAGLPPRVMYSSD